MSGLVLTLRAPLEARLDAKSLIPHRLARLERVALDELELPYGNRMVPLGSLFAVRGTPGDRLTISGHARLDNVGAGLQDGEIVIKGDCGVRLGAGMTGGRIEVSGSCGDFAAAGMSGGRIEIAGDCGDRTGAADTSQRRGMTSGMVHIGGSAGLRAGERMRGGLIVIDGDCGALAAADMIAGTLAVGGTIGDNAGAGMKRGTILLRAALDATPNGFADAGEHDMVFVDFLRRSIADLAGWLPAEQGHARRLVGDLGAGGQAEILILS